EVGRYSAPASGGCDKAPSFPGLRPMRSTCMCAPQPPREGAVLSIAIPAVCHLAGILPASRLSAELPDAQKQIFPLFPVSPAKSVRRGERGPCEARTYLLLRGRSARWQACRDNCPQ